MTKRAKAVSATAERLTKLRTPAYRPAMPWKGLLVGVAVVGLLAVLTAPRSGR